MSGVFITFEGGEGAGKSTLIKRLGEHYKKIGMKYLLTREPGGTPDAEDIRALLVNGEPGKYSAEAEAMLNYAARDAHLRKVIRPALAEGKKVLCDRFMDSTVAYQGAAGGCPMYLIKTMERMIVGETVPDVTFIFDLDPKIGLERAKSRGAGVEDRYERKGIEFHEKLRAAFLKIAQRNPQRCVVVDASKPPEEVWVKVRNSLQARAYG
jgi:dTMP kinase